MALLLCYIDVRTDSRRSKQDIRGTKSDPSSSICHKSVVKPFISGLFGVFAETSLRRIVSDFGLPQAFMQEGEIIRPRYTSADFENLERQ